MAPDFPFGNWIQGVMVKVVEWDGRQVVGGIVLHWADGHQDRWAQDVQPQPLLLVLIQVRGGRK